PDERTSSGSEGVSRQSHRSHSRFTRLLLCRGGQWKVIGAERYRGQVLLAEEIADREIAPPEPDCHRMLDLIAADSYLPFPQYGPRRVKVPVLAANGKAVERAVACAPRHETAADMVE